MKLLMQFVLLAVLPTFFCSIASAAQSQSCTGNSLCGNLVIGGKQGQRIAKYFNTKVMRQDGFSISAFGKNSPGAKLKFRHGKLKVTHLDINTNAIITFTYLGADTSFTNFFSTSLSPTGFDTQSSQIGSSFSETVTGNGPMDFQFLSANEDSGFDKSVFGILRKNGGYTINGLNYADLLIYNDSGRDRDFNDMVIGVNMLCPTPVSAVPEPSTYAMLLAGLGLIGLFVTTRRNKRVNPLGFA